MEITKVKHWRKIVQGEGTDHVRIAYIEGDKEITLHQSGENATAAPEFYEAFKAMALPICLACGLSEELATGIRVNSISLASSEDKEGNDNTTYTFSCTLKAGHARAELSVTIQHKFLPEGFEGAVVAITAQAKEYAKGTRGQTNLFDEAEAVPGDESESEDESGEDVREDSDPE